MEENHRAQLEALQDIRSMMERSSRFLSLSGLSGIWAGVCALAGVSAMYLWLKMPAMALDYQEALLGNTNWGLTYRGAFVAIGACTVAATMLGVYFFNARKARKKGHALWDASARRLFTAMMLPLAIGGVFCLALARYDLVGLIAPTTLVFYGMALIHCDKHTIGDVRKLGLAEVVLGLMGLFSPGYGLHLWAVGFGLLHILYGAWMYARYEKS